ncbi:MAG TPA: zinc ABC transporter substrate-binding protein [Candidatus Sumerlaeia bacterium]|nr:zinc ABC transporter substrate-binding protein [Candidatus Sumerlaeia bacterium]
MMMKKTVKFILTHLSILLLIVSCSFQNNNKSPVIAVTTSYLECAARDICGDEIAIARLVPPGLCPGHFDIAPGIIKEIKNSVLFLRFDFQKVIDEKIRAIAPKSFVIQPIPAPEGLCIPDSYYQIVQKTYEGLCAAFPDKKATFDDNFANIQKKINDLTNECEFKINDSGLKGAKVISSGHQSFFCRWLGLDVMAEYSGADSVSPPALQSLLNKESNADVQFVVSNLQEGGQMGSAIASRLGVPLVVFSNFPSMAPTENDFYSLIRNNLNNLLSNLTSKK